MKKQVAILLFLLVALFLSGCSDSQDSTAKQSDNKIDIYTTVYPLQYFAQEIGGKYVHAETVYPPGTDEHSYEPSQKDIINMTEADLFFYIGYNLEGFVTKAQPILVDEGVKTIAVGESVNLAGATTEEHHEDAHSVDDSHNHGDVDPHLWLDPIYAEQMATAIKDELAKQMPDQADYFEAQYNKLNKKLETIDKKLADTIQNSKTNEIIVSHGAYGYWEKRYGLKQISVTGLTGSSEPSQKDLENIVKTAKKHNLHYVIFEQNVSSKLTKIIQNEIGAKALTLHNLSVLTDADIKAGSDYESIMKQNIETLQTALND
jgi:zinc transport system substrate-binding protein